MHSVPAPGGSDGSSEFAEDCELIFALGIEPRHRGFGEVAALGGSPLVVRLSPALLK